MLEQILTCWSKFRWAGINFDAGVNFDVGVNFDAGVNLDVLELISQVPNVSLAGAKVMPSQQEASRPPDNDNPIMPPNNSIMSSQQPNHVNIVGFFVVQTTFVMFLWCILRVRCFF